MSGTAGTPLFSKPTLTISVIAQSLGLKVPEPIWIIVVGDYKAPILGCWALGLSKTLYLLATTFKSLALHLHLPTVVSVYENTNSVSYTCKSLVPLNREHCQRSLQAKWADPCGWKTFQVESGVFEFRGCNYLKTQTPKPATYDSSQIHTSNITRKRRPRLPTA